MPAQHRQLEEQYCLQFPSLRYVVELALVDHGQYLFDLFQHYFEQ
jgi:hypothetical protein